MVFFICVVSAFRCAYCYFLNPARKMRPQAPRLPEVTHDLKLSSEGLAPSPGTDEEDDQSVLGDSDTQAGCGRPCSQIFPNLSTFRNKNLKFILYMNMVMLVFLLFVYTLMYMFLMCESKLKTDL